MNNRLSVRKWLAAGLMTAGVVFLIPAAQALSLLVPTDTRLDPLELKSQVMEVKIDNQAAQTKIKQVFHNRYGQALEATYLMPIPKGAHVTNFAMMMNGKMVQGEVLEKEKARQIYTDIVRRARDPGLIEYVDQEIFRARIFPIPPNGDQSVEITVSHLLTLDNGIVEYQWPFEAPRSVKERGRAEAAGEFDFKMDIQSKQAIRTVYSPSHKVSVDKKDENHAVVRLEDLKSGEPVFRCYYTLSDKAVGLNALTTRKEGAGEGTFLLLISPGDETEGKSLPPVDFTFVFDISSSMLTDNKIDAAKKALTYCLGALRPVDGFTLITFSTEVETWSNDFLPANEDNLKKARQFVADIRARGGTNIDGALAAALSRKPRENRLHTILFITDGQPTIGVTDPDQIIRNLEKTNSQSLRVFACGVGYDVNTVLLDRISQQTRSVTEYIRPKEDLEVAVSRLFDKISKPVMTNLKIDWGNLKVRNVYPQTLPDLFAGTQLTVFGRYEGGGHFALTLTGKVGGEEKKFTYEATFAEKAQGENEFVETLWATRRVAFLLEQIRQNGETAEVRDEVVELAKKHGIVTPYTSYLVQEDQPLSVATVPVPPAVMLGRPFGGLGAAPGRAGGGVAGGFGGVTEESLRERRSGYSNGAVAGRPESESRARGAEAPVTALRKSAGPAPTPAPGTSFQMSLPGADAVLPRASAAPSGQAAVDYSVGLRQLKEAERLDTKSDVAGVRTVEGRTFRKTGDVWTEVRDAKDKKERKTLKVKYLSDAWFEIAKLRPELKKVLALGEKVEFDSGSYRIVVGPEGEEKMTDELRTALKK